MSNSVRLKKFRTTGIPAFFKKYSLTSDVKISKGEKVKLCSSDDFNAVAKDFENKFAYGKGPVIVSNVGGFYVAASLLGTAASKCTTKPYAFFFDKKSGNTLNALYNSLLIKACDTKEGYIKYLFGIDDVDLIKAIKPSAYSGFIEQVLNEDPDFASLTKKEKREVLKTRYERDKENIDALIKTQFIDGNVFLKKRALDDFSLAKIVNYCKKRQYDPEKHLKMLIEKAEKKLRGEELALFKKCAEKMVNYISYKGNYQDLVKYLLEDIKLNEEHHILANDDIFKGFKSLFNVKGSYIKFIQGIDLSTAKSVKRLEAILKEESFISQSGDDSLIDLAFIPHMSAFKEAYNLVKTNVQDYIMLYKEGTNKNNYFVMNNTATLDVRTLASIGGKFIEEERENRIPLKDMSQIETQKGFPLLMFMAGANFGNIYHSESDTQNMIDLAIANKVDTVYIQGLIYSTYYHNQTSRRMLTDPTYETLSSRLQAAQKVIKKLNEAGIKVVYQMGDEEYHLYEDLFKIYVKEQGVKGNNFLAREDLRSKFDWVRPIIIQKLIPYLIRSGEDTINFYTDDAKKTRVSQVCTAIKRYVDGFPMGDLAECIDPKFLEDTDMFKVVYSLVEQMDKDDKAIILNLMSNPNNSVITQYTNARAGALKNTRLTNVGQLNVDSREGLMSITYEDDKAIVTVPQMINDEYYIKHPELLSGIKDHVKEDPTYKRVTQIGKNPNYPGGYILTGDLREKMTIVPYFKRARKLMEHVQKTGEGMPLMVEGKLNDWQIGSLTERPDLDIKFIDYLMYEAGCNILAFNGDPIQGFNYKSFANENRHQGATAITQQMISHNKMIKPYMRAAFGIIDNDFGACHLTDEIIKHLASKGLINYQQGLFGNCNTIRRGIDYKTVDLDLPIPLKPYEEVIRNKLSNIINVVKISIEEGNHEANSDWDHKGFDEVEMLRQELNNLKEFTGSDVDISYTEYHINKQGDIVNASASVSTINGYNTLNGHNLRKGGHSITHGASRWLSSVKPSLPRIDIVDFAHYHVFETSVIENTLFNCTGSGAGVSGYDFRLGYSSSPIYVLKKYMPDGSIQIETIGKAFLDSYKIKNPYVKEKGLDNFIAECMTEEAVMLADIPNDSVQKVYQRRLVPRKTSIIGPKVD